jgi:SAM-dependent methyltransferase
MPLLDKSTPETTDGPVRRLEIIRAWLAAASRNSTDHYKVLDFGSGTGLGLALPLAKCLPHVNFVAYDINSQNCDFLETAARAADLQNISAIRELGQLVDGAPFDTIIVSEVLEHLSDPITTLRQLRTLLSPSGDLVVTIPNGYGAFEIGTLLYDILWIAGPMRAMSALRHVSHKKSRLPGDCRASTSVTDTYGIDPHVQFFSLRDIYATLGAAGFAVIEARARGVLSGFPFYYFDSCQVFCNCNQKLSDLLPLCLSSAWMFRCIKTVQSDLMNFPERGLSKRTWRWLKSRVNRRRWATEARPRENGCILEPCSNAAETSCLSRASSGTNT